MVNVPCDQLLDLSSGLVPSLAAFRNLRAVVRVAKGVKSGVRPSITMGPCDRETPATQWCPVRDSNPCYSLERAVS